MERNKLWRNFFEEQKILMECAKICESLSKVQDSKNFVNNLIVIQEYSIEVTKKLYKKGILKNDRK